MADDKKTDAKTVTLYAPSGSKVTVSKDTADKIGARFSKTKPKS